MTMVALLSNRNCKVRFTGMAESKYDTVRLVKGKDLIRGEYHTVQDEVLDVYDIKEEGINYIGLRPQFDHDDFYLVITFEYYLSLVEKGVFDMI